ncbi:MAG: hypothetical protein ACNA7E_01470, partial [Wenzhouxiangellaceae bacterium]
MKYPLIPTVTVLVATLALTACGDHAHDGSESHSHGTESHAHDSGQAHDHGPDADHVHDTPDTETQAFYGDEADDASSGENHDGEHGHEHGEDEHAHEHED